MPTYSVRLFCEAGHGLLPDEMYEAAEETLVVDAPTAWAAKSVAAMRMSIRPMGRILRAYDAETGEEITPPALGEFRPGQFEIDGLPGVYRGFTRGEMWNGFAVPYFPLTVARHIADDYASHMTGLNEQAKVEYDSCRGLIRFYDPSLDEWDEWGPVEVGDETDYGLNALYSVGARYWTWEEV